MAVTNDEEYIDDVNVEEDLENVEDVEPEEVDEDEEEAQILESTVTHAKPFSKATYEDEPKQKLRKEPEEITKPQKIEDEIASSGTQGSTEAKLKNFFVDIEKECGPLCMASVIVCLLVSVLVVAFAITIMIFALIKRGQKKTIITPEANQPWL